MSKHRRLLALTAAATAAVLGAGFTVSQGTASAAAPPAPAGVTKADVITYLKGLTGRNALSGQQGGANSNPGQWVQKVHDITGQYPGLWGGDFGFSQDDINNRQTVINQAKTEWANGTLGALTMHACRPDVATCSFEGGANPVKGSRLSAAEWTQIVQDGTSLNAAYKRKLDQFVPYFQQLKDAGIPIMFRPLHEMNEAWAWWGGQAGTAGSARLYQITHDYLESKGLNNIIWVWALKDVANASAQARSYYPGDNYVDVIGLDVWVQKFPGTDWYQALKTIAGTNKPIALAEVGSVPQPAQLAAQPDWVFWSVWLDWLTKPDYNTNASIQAGYYDARTLNQGEVHIPTGTPPTTPPPTGGGRTGAITGIGGKCIDVAAAATTNGSLIQLWDCNGSGAQQWAAQGNGHLRNPQSGRDLDVPGGTTANGTRLQIWDTNTNAWQVWALPA